jgi:hypothetical protein
LSILYTISDSPAPTKITLSIDNGPEQEFLSDKSKMGLIKINSDKNFSV